MSDVSDAPESAESSTDSDSQSDDMERQAVLNGEEERQRLVPPSDLAGKTVSNMSSRTSFILLSAAKMV